MKPFQTSYATSPTLLAKMQENPTEEDWERFYNIYRPIILFFAQCRGMRQHDAENILQQSMIALMGQFRHGFQYDPERGKFRGYLSTMVGNMVKKENRRSAKRPYRADTWQINELKASELEQISDEELLNLALLRAALQRVRAYYEARDSDSFSIFYDIVFRKVPIKKLAERHNTNPNNLYQTKDRVKRRIEKTCHSLRQEDLDGLDRLEDTSGEFELPEE